MLNEEIVILNQLFQKEEVDKTKRLKTSMTTKTSFSKNHIPERHSQVSGVLWASLWGIFGINNRRTQEAATLSGFLGKLGQLSFSFRVCVTSPRAYHTKPLGGVNTHSCTHNRHPSLDRSYYLHTVLAFYFHYRQNYAYVRSSQKLNLKV